MRLGPSAYDTMQNWSRSRSWGVSQGLWQSAGARQALFGGDPLTNPAGAVFGTSTQSASGFLSLTAELQSARETVAMARTAAVRPRAQAWTGVDITA